jgi:hypothetical protein
MSPKNSYVANLEYFPNENVFGRLIYPTSANHFPTHNCCCATQCLARAFASTFLTLSSIPPSPLSFTTLNYANHGQP